MQRSRSARWIPFPLTLLAILLLYPAGAEAQDEFPLWEVNGGFSYMRLRAPGLPEGRNSVGGWGGMAWNPARHFGLTAEFAAQKNPQCAQNDIECIIDQLSQPTFVTHSALQFLAGPRVRTGGYTFDFFAHAQVGLARTRATVIDLNTGDRMETRSGARLAFGFGGGMDWNLSNNFAVRAFQVDFIPVRHSPDWRHSFRIQAGVVARFGQRDRFP